MTEYYIGLMSGTSIDGIDAALVEIEGDSCKVVTTCQYPLPMMLTHELNQLCQTGDDEVKRLGQSSVKLACCCASAVNEILKISGLNASDITAIGSHGQTIRHFPPHEHQCGFSLQIGHPAYIAAQTGIDVIADFRTMDMAVGGEGAPLVPAFHHTLFQSADCHRAIVNIGGIANITWLPAAGSEKQVVGFDTGPGNTLLDLWYRKHQNGQYDKDATWGLSGTPVTDLLNKMLQEPFFSRSRPKSTGRELFNLNWLEQQLCGGDHKAQDIQATLAALTASTIADQVLQLLQQEKNSHPCELYLCGGGAHNPQLVALLRHCLPQIPIASTAELGLDPDWVEAVAFAWLAKRHQHGESGNLPAVTGARQKVILGARYPKPLSICGQDN